MTAPITLLRTRTVHSLHGGLIDPAKFGEYARERGVAAAAITDVDGMWGTIAWSKYLPLAGVQPIMGVDLATDFAGVTRRLIFLATDTASWIALLNLYEAAAKAGQGVRPVVDIDMITGLPPTLKVLDGHPNSPLAGFIRTAQHADYLAHMKNMMGDGYVIEICRNQELGDRRQEAALIAISQEFSVPVVATTDTRIMKASQQFGLLGMAAVASKRNVDAVEPEFAHESHAVPTSIEFRQLFVDLPIAVDNANRLAQTSAWTCPTSAKPRLPQMAETRETENDLLRKLATEGMTKRLPSISKAPELYWARLDYELKVIADLGFSAYFLIIKEIIDCAHALDIPVGPGRGSGAGCLTAWNLWITDLDPLRYDLLFERFLNAERVSMPDFDIDFSETKPIEAWLVNRWGEDKVALISTIQKLKGRSAINDAASALGYPFMAAQRVSGLVPNKPGDDVSIAEAMKQVPALRSALDGSPKWRDLAMHFEGAAKSYGKHPSGIVVSPTPIKTYMPVGRDKTNFAIVNYNMKTTEDIGGIKIDLLNLDCLGVIQRAIRNMEALGFDTAPCFDPEMNDPAVYKNLQKGNTRFVFQLEAQGMTETTVLAQPQCFEDIIALIALYRPGPMENIPKYIACKNGRDKPEFMHETIDPIVKMTYGVIIYQEQVLQIAQAYAGYSLGGADLLRRAMGKKIKAEMDAQRDVFVKGAMVKNGVSHQDANHVFDLVDKFAGYGFNKSHAAAYACLSYRTAWIKTHCPAALLAATFATIPDTHPRLAPVYGEASRLGISLIAPIITDGPDAIAVKNNAGRYSIRLGFSQMQGLDSSVARRIFPVTSIDMLRDRLDANRTPTAERLGIVASGACDSFDPSPISIAAKLCDPKASSTTQIDMLAQMGVQTVAQRWSTWKLSMLEKGLWSINVIHPAVPESLLSKTGGENTFFGIIEKITPATETAAGIIRIGNAERSEDYTAQHISNLSNLEIGAAVQVDFSILKRQTVIKAITVIHGDISYIALSRIDKDDLVPIAEIIKAHKRTDTGRSAHLILELGYHLNGGVCHIPIEIVFDDQLNDLLNHHFEDRWRLCSRPTAAHAAIAEVNHANDITAITAISTDAANGSELWIDTQIAILRGNRSVTFKTGAEGFIRTIPVDTWINQPLDAR